MSPPKAKDRLSLIFEKLIEEIKRAPQDIFILGKTDRGKTYLALNLLKSLKKEGLMYGYFNSDIGQAQIGMPASLSFGYFIQKRQRLCSQLSVFFGDITPSSNLEWFIFCFSKLYHECKRVCDYLIIDTTGYIRPQRAKFLKLMKIQLSKDPYILCIGNKEEFDFLKSYEKRLLLLEPLPEAKKRSMRERELFRRRLFKDYFKNNKRVSLFKKNLQLMEGTLLGFQDGRGFLRFLGVVYKVKRENIEILIPKGAKPEEANFFSLSNLIVDPLTGIHSRIHTHTFSPHFHYFHNGR